MREELKTLAVLLTGAVVAAAVLAPTQLDEATKTVRRAPVAWVQDAERRDREKPGEDLRDKRKKGAKWARNSATRGAFSSTKTYSRRQHL